jgi:hypothetical protein
MWQLRLAVFIGWMCVAATQPAFAWQAVGAPANDLCANAMPIAGEGTFPFDNLGAATDGPAHATCTFFGQNQIANDVWYCWTATCDSGVQLETCGMTTVDTKIAVYDGCACPPGDANLIACNEDDCDLQSRVRFETVAGQQYLIRIGNFAGPSGDPGTGQFSLTCVPVPSNDRCQNAVGPLAIPSTTAGTTNFATLDGAPPCIAELTAPGVWYTVRGTGTTITASLCSAATNYDTRIAVYCGDCDMLTCVGGNDQFCGDVSQISWCAQEGATYFILVHGFRRNIGSFELELTEDGVPCKPLVECPVAPNTSLDIKPGSCPNPLNPGSHGVIPMSFAGTNAFDVTLIDPTKLQLARADGVGGAVTPIASRIRIEDTASPFSGPSCDCHELTGDGRPDLSMKFKTDDVVAALQLEGLPGGTVLELVLSGMLTDGTGFSASDCVVIVPIGEPSNLRVRSNAPGVLIDVAPLDQTDDGEGFPEFERSYVPGERVTLNAPSVVDGRTFIGWRFGGVWITTETKLQVDLGMETTLIEAVYTQPPRTMRTSSPTAGQQ